MLKLSSTLFYAVAVLDVFLTANVFGSDVVDGDDSIDQYEDLTNNQLHESESPIDNRKKRNEDGEVWHLRVLFSNNSYVTLNLVEVDTVLANGNTPLYKSSGTPGGKVTYTPHQQTLGEKIGDFTIYQDYKNEAAVVFFHRDNTLFGHIQWIRFTFNNIRAPQKKMSTVCEKRPPETDPLQQVFFNSGDFLWSYVSNLRLNGPPECAYPELLLLLDQDYLKNETEALKKILAWWNFADMLYSVIKSPRIKLNIAGLVLAQNEYTNPWIKEVYRKDLNSFVSGDGLAAAGRFYAKQKTLPQNWDIVVSYIWTIMRSTSGGSVAGVSRIGASCHTRESDVILVSYRVAPSDVNAHELGHVLGSKHDQDYEQCKEGGRLMSTNNPHNYDSLHWSKCSLDDIYQHFRKTKSTCYDNYPRTARIGCL